MAIRFVRKVDIMTVECLLALGQEACKTAMQEIQASRKQGLFLIVGEMLEQDPDKSREPSSDLIGREQFLR